jgi:hypothetical protein
MTSDEDEQMVWWDGYRSIHEMGRHTDRICGSEAVGEIKLLRNSSVSAVTFGYF